MRRRNLQSMGHDQNDPRERGAWAPFVGVALAVLTAGSLVLFSLVAQRTSLDGFSTRGVTAVAPSQDTPNSITLPGAAGSSAGGGADDQAPTASALLTLPPAPLLTASNEDTGFAGPSDAAAPTADTDAVVAPTTSGVDGDPAARFDDGGARAQFFRDGEVRAAADDRKGDATKAKGSGKAKKGKKVGKKNKAAARKGPRHPRPARGNKGRKHSDGRAMGSSQSPSQAASHRSRGSGRPAPSRPAHSSRPSPAARPQQASKAKPKSPPGHSNTTGKGHSKGRGRGHAHD